MLKWKIVASVLPWRPHREGSYTKLGTVAGSQYGAAIRKFLRHNKRGTHTVCIHCCLWLRSPRIVYLMVSYQSHNAYGVPM